MAVLKQTCTYLAEFWSPQRNSVDQINNKACTLHRWPNIIDDRQISRRVQAKVHFIVTLFVT